MNASALESALEQLKSHDYNGCLSTLKEAWLKDPLEPGFPHLMSQLMEAAGKKELADQLAKLVDDLKANRLNPTTLFETGFHFSDAREHEIAIMLLKQCSTLVPKEEIVNYELGFSLMSLKHYAEASHYFEQALSEHENFDTLLNLAVCCTCLRNLSQASKMLEMASRLTLDEEQMKELDNQRCILQRLGGLHKKNLLTTRDWFYVLYGSILLNEPAAALPKEFELINVSNAEIAASLLILRGVIEGLGLNCSRIEFLNANARPLTEAFGELTGHPVEPYQPENPNESTLLIASRAEDFNGYHNYLTHNHPLRSVFAFSLPPAKTVSLTPDIVAYVCQSIKLPWDNTDGDKQKAMDLKDLESAYKFVYPILDKAYTLEADPSIIKQIQDVTGYYHSRTELILINNSRHFPRRPAYLAEVPYS